MIQHSEKRGFYYLYLDSVEISATVYSFEDIPISVPLQASRLYFGEVRYYATPLRFRIASFGRRTSSSQLVVESSSLSPFFHTHISWDALLNSRLLCGSELFTYASCYRAKEVTPSLQDSQLYELLAY